MPLVAAAVVPAAPLLVPEIAPGPEPGLEALRTASMTAVRRMLAAMPDRVLVLAAAASAVYPEGSAGTFAGLGVSLRVALGVDAQAEPVLPQPLCVGAALLAAAGWDAPAAAEACDATTRAAPLEGRTGLLVVADGSTCRTPKAPGGFDPDAEATDAETLALLSRPGSGGYQDLAGRGLADGRGIAGLDAFAAADGIARISQDGGGPTLRATVLYDGAPFGVGSFALAWDPA